MPGTSCPKSGGAKKSKTTVSGRFLYRKNHANIILWTIARPELIEKNKTALSGKMQVCYASHML